MRRFTRLTNAFSKKLENHAHMGCAVRRLVQFAPQDAADLASDGGRDRKAALVDGDVIALIDARSAKISAQTLVDGPIALAPLPRWLQIDVGRSGKSDRS